MTIEKAANLTAIIMFLSDATPEQVMALLLAGAALYWRDRDNDAG
jgi:hypothetical protein